MHELEEDGRLSEKKPVATGFYKVNKYLLENSLVEVDLSMMNANQIVGTLKSTIFFSSNSLS